MANNPDQQARSASPGVRRKRRWPAFTLITGLLVLTMLISIVAAQASDMGWPEGMERGNGLPGDWLLTWLPVLGGVGLGIGLVLLCLRVRKSLRSFRRRFRPVISVAASGDSSGRYEALFENANDLIQGIALGGKLLYANTAWHELLDYNEQEMTKLTIFDVVSPDLVEGFKESFQRATVGVKIKSLDTTFISKYGKRIVVEGSLHAELVDDRPASIQAIFRDMTERKRAEAALKQSEERFSRVFAASPIAIAICTIDGGRMLDANESFLTMLGYDRNEIVGRTDLKLGFWSSEADRERVLQKVTSGQIVRDEQCKLRPKRGEERQALISAEAIDVNNERCVLLIIHDNTERLNLEAQLRQAQKMEGIGQLAAGIAHDFNNILTIIQGHVARLKVGQVDQKVRDSVEQVLIAADRAATLTRQLLTFCRKQAMVAKVVDLNEAVAHVSTMLERILGEDIALDVKLGNNVPCIDADAAMLELALINLACNARDAMPKGGKLSITSAAVTVPESHSQHQPKAQAGDHVCLSVNDTGCGMTPETLRRIFEPFFTTKDIGKGTGLGLATVYGIVDQHHGWIEVTSELNKGTTFKIYLPQSTRSRPAHTESTASNGQETAEPAKLVGGKETILLVEDEMALRELARVVLEDCEYRILEAGSGVQALKVWENHKHEIDMLLTDMVMPEGMSGRDLAEKLQAEKPGLRVLYSSGYSPDVVGGYFKLPENCFFLPKPYLPPKLAGAVRECLDNVKLPSVEPLAA
ncbi:MAG TPA: PAS domain S-box protein [Candidatus Acidoferrum sp.]|nr:PAS domain S-box protein [Candidatus Acidoferrum sp.]